MTDPLVRPLADTPPEYEQRWRELIEQAFGEITELHHNQEIWRFINDKLPGQPGSAISHQALTRWYVDTQAAAVRRLTRIGGHDKKSVHQLLLDIRSHLGDLGGGRNGVALDADTIDQDIATLKAESTKKVARWADENVAHIGVNRTVQPTFGDLDQAIDMLGQLLQKYYLLIEGGHLLTAIPDIQGDWKAPFAAWTS